MIIQWDESISVHDKTLDDQHREFIKLINQLDDVTSGTTDISVKITHAILSLQEYANKHFSYEESYFINHDFPESAAHIAEHRRFMSAIEAMRLELNMQGATARLANDISRFVADWLIMHVRGMDHRYAVFIETGKLPAMHVPKKFGRA